MVMRNFEIRTSVIMRVMNVHNFSFSFFCSSFKGIIATMLVVDCMFVEIVRMDIVRMIKVMIKLWMCFMMCSIFMVWVIMAMMVVMIVVSIVTNIVVLIGKIQNVVLVFNVSLTVHFCQVQEFNIILRWHVVQKVLSFD